MLTRVIFLQKTKSVSELKVIKRNVRIQRDGATRMLVNSEIRRKALS